MNGIKPLMVDLRGFNAYEECPQSVVSMTAPTSIRLPKKEAGGVHRTVKSALSRPMLERLQVIVQELQQRSFPNCSTLVQRLEVDRRTVLRDLDFLRDRQQLPIAFDRARNGYFLTEAVANLPFIQITEGELLALFIAERSSAVGGNLGTAQKLRAIARKLGSMMPETVTLSMDDLHHSVSVQAYPAASLDLEAVSTLGKAIKTRRAVRFAYAKPGENKTGIREVWPLHLFTYECAWYLLSYDPGVGNTRTFHLSRMQALVLTKTSFTPPPNIDVHKLLKGSFGIFFGRKRRFAVTLEFDAGVASHIAERQWHHSQRNTLLPGGRLRVRFTVSALQDILRWVLSWAPHVDVIAPLELKEATRDASQAFVRRLRAK